MTIKVRDPGGVLRTVDAVKVRGPDGVLRTIDFIKVRGPDNVLREVYATAGTPAPSNPAFISPGTSNTSGSAASATALFNARSSGATPTVYAWGVVEGPGAVVSGGDAATAQLRITVSEVGGFEVATFYCDMTIDGTVHRATCSMSRQRQATSGGGGLPQA